MFTVASIYWNLPGLASLFLTVGRQPDIVDAPELRSLLTFEWPSVAYALNILAWDIFFALSMFFAAPVLTGSRCALYGWQHCSIRQTQFCNLLTI